MISPTFIRDYLVEKFKTDGKLVSDGTELVIPSIFISNDYKGHMSINLDTGLWQCFKSKEKGNFLKLYTILEGVTYGKAKGELAFNSYLSKYNSKEDNLAKTNIKKEKFDFNKVLEEDCVLVEARPSNLTDTAMVKAVKFLRTRCLLQTGIFYL